MDKNELKSMWHSLHVSTEYRKVNVEEILKAKHSKIISRVLFEQKLKVFLFLIIFIVYFSLMTYAFSYLKLNLSLKSIIPLSIAGLFILIRATSEICRLIILTNTTDDFSVKESILFFKKKLNRIIKIDFLFYLILFYTLIVIISATYIKDIGGIKLLPKGDQMNNFLMVLILILLFTPWLVRFQDIKRYKKLFSNLNNSIISLGDEL
jgi:hypothetical protein